MAYIDQSGCNPVSEVQEGFYNFNHTPPYQHYGDGSQEETGHLGKDHRAGIAQEACNRTGKPEYNADNSDIGQESKNRNRHTVGICQKH